MFRALAGSIVLDAGLCAAALAQPQPTYGPLNVTLTPYNAVGDAVWGVTGCSGNGGSPAVVTCPSLTVPPASPQTLILDDGAGAGVPLVGTVTAVTSASGTTTITLGTSTTLSGTVVHVPALLVDPSNQGSGYAFGTSQTLSCGGCAPLGTSLAVGTPAVMTGVAATVVSAGGSSGLSSCVATLTQQTALSNQSTSISFAISSGSISGPISIVSGGLITGDAATNSSGSYTHAVLGCGFSPVATIALTYGVVLEQATSVGAYGTETVCTGSVSALTTSGTGTGLKVFCPANYLNTVSWGTDNTIAFRKALASSNVNANASTPRPLYVPAGNYLIQPLNGLGSAGWGSSGAGECVLSTSTSMTQGNCSNSGSCAGVGSCGSSGCICVAGLAAGYGSWLGDEHDHSNIFVIPQTASVTFDVFAWFDSHKQQSDPQFGNTQTFAAPTPGGSKNLGGSSLRHLTVIGDRATQTDESALTFYGKSELAFIDNVVISYMKGHAIGAGYSDGTSNDWGNLFESRITNTSLDHDGDGTGNPSLELTAKNSEGSNVIDLVDLSIFDSFGPGILMHQLAGTGPFPATRSIHLADVTVDSTGMSLFGQAKGDLVDFNDQSATSTVSNILCRNLDLINPPLGYAALHVGAATPSNAAWIDCAGSVESHAATFAGSSATALDDGRGVAVDGCSECSFRMAGNASPDFNLLVGTETTGASPTTCAGPSIGGTLFPALATPGLTYDGTGAESALTTCLDPLSLNLIAFPGRKLLANGTLTNIFPADPIGQLSQAVSSTGTTLTFPQSGVAGLIPVSVSTPLWTILRSGPTAPFTDTWDSAANIVNSLNFVAGTSGYVVAGQVYRLRICNLSQFTESLSGTASGITVSGNQTVSSGSCTNFALEIGSVASPTVVIVGK